MRQPAVRQANLGALALALSSTVDAVRVLPPDVFTTHSLTSFKYGQITFSESTSPRISKKRTPLALSSRGFLTQLFFPLNTYLYMKLYLIFFFFFLSCYNISPKKTESLPVLFISINPGTKTVLGT